MAYLAFTDDIGAATLRNIAVGSADLQALGGRFSNWVGHRVPIGDAASAAANGRLYRFRRRWQYGATFELDQISEHLQGGAYPKEIAERLIAHLLNGGTCEVGTEDNAATPNTYPTCSLMPDTEPQLVQSDRELLLYRLSLALINVATPAVPMVCRYGRTS